jgi:hypothetical protein
MDGKDEKCVKHSAERRKRDDNMKINLIGKRFEDTGEIHLFLDRDTWEHKGIFGLYER